jgi:spore coat protein JA
MNSYYKTYQPYSIPFDPCPPINIKTYSTPPNLYMGYQPPNLPQFTPGEALRAGTLWKPLYDPYYNSRELAARGGNPT